jgi:hypothetical protein
MRFMIVSSGLDYHDVYNRDGPTTPCLQCGLYQ